VTFTSENAEKRMYGETKKRGGGVLFFSSSYLHDNVYSIVTKAGQVQLQTREAQDPFLSYYPPLAINYMQFEAGWKSFGESGLRIIFLLRA
jgi:hypothetical protein